MDGGEENQEFSGIEVFLMRPENAVMMDKLVNDIETIIYHRIDFGVSISDKEKYELGRYIGKAQLLINYGTYLVEHTKDENTAKKIGRKIIRVINDISILYLILAENTDLNRFDNVFRFFKDNVNDLNELIFKHVYI